MMYWQEIMDILARNIGNEPGYTQAVDRWGYGNVQFRTRLTEVAEFCASCYPGDLLEIGCYRGETTIELAKVARGHDRRIIGIDPWQVGLQNCDGTEYAEFEKRMEDYADILDLLRMPSEWPRCVAAIQKRPLCFAFVDGAHTYDNCLSDIRAVGHCAGVIAVDDVRWNDDVHRAFETGAQYLERATLIYPLCKEGYILP